VFGPRLEGAHRRLERAGISVVPAAAAAVDPTGGLLIPVPSDLDVSRALSTVADAFPADLDEDHANLTGPIPVDLLWTLRSGQPVRQIARAEALRMTIPRVLNIQAIGLPTAIAGLGRLLKRSTCFVLPVEGGQAVADVLIPALQLDDQPHD
jgi:hypothetical protein